ncbi:hypothetical protein JW933_03275 [candidate division FCPU426 bacterium]|nr:hypothetical protein [candidate division FCPU426 bacterium]
MRMLRAGVLGCLCIILLGTALWAAEPAADTAPFAKKKRQSLPPDQLRATYQTEKLKLPPQPWKIPEATLDVTGGGLSLYYLIPYQRVKKILPGTLAPYPGPDDIWFRVDVIDWYSVRPRSQPGKKIKKFVELAYRFEMQKQGRRGTYPLRIYMDSPWAVLWSRYYGGYEAYPLPRADVNFSPVHHFFQLRRGKFAILVLDAGPRQGVGARMTDIFSRGADSDLWLGSGQDYVLADDLENVKTVVRRYETEVKAAQVRTLLLTEPVKWQILHEDEVIIPDKILVLEKIAGTWVSSEGKKKEPAAKPSMPASQEEDEQEVFMDQE